MVMLDRFAELQRSVPPPPEPQKGRAFEKGAALESGVDDAVAKETALLEIPTFVEQIEAIKKSHAMIQKLGKEIEDLHKQALASASIEDSATISQQINMLTARVNKVIDQTRTSVRALEARNAELETIAPKGSANMRLRAMNTRQMGQQFIRVTKDFQKMQMAYKDKYVSQVQRQYKIVNPSATADDLTALAKDIDTGEAKQAIFAMAVKEDAKKELGKMKNRLDDMKTIEQSIMTLNHLFLEMQDIVGSQQDIINRIGYNVEQTEEFTAKAAKSMEGAVQSQKSIQKKKWIFTALALLAIAIVVIVLYTTFRPRVYYQ